MIFLAWALSNLAVAQSMALATHSYVEATRRRRALAHEHEARLGDGLFTSGGASRDPRDVNTPRPRCAYCRTPKHQTHDDRCAGCGAPQ